MQKEAVHLIFEMNTALCLLIVEYIGEPTGIGDQIQIRQFSDEQLLPNANNDKSLYQQITGSPLYLGINSRPYISSATHALTKRVQRSSNYGQIAANLRRVRTHSIIASTSLN